jgi:hypothetical protein
MSKLKINKVTVSVKRGTARVKGLPAGTKGKVQGKEGKDVTVSINRKAPQEETNDLLLEQNKVLCTRLEKLENTWPRRLWKILNKRRSLW